MPVRGTDLLGDTHDHASVSIGNVWPSPVASQMCLRLSWAEKKSGQGRLKALLSSYFKGTPRKLAPPGLSPHGCPLQAAPGRPGLRSKSQNSKRSCDLSELDLSTKNLFTHRTHLATCFTHNDKVENIVRVFKNMQETCTCICLFYPHAEISRSLSLW